MATEKEPGISINSETAKGSYSNLAIIAHSQSEFILDFASMLPGMIQPDISNRIIMAPEHAKRLMLLLQENIRNFESQNGTISLGEAQKNTFPIGGLNGNGGAIS